MRDERQLSVVRVRRVSSLGRRTPRQFIFVEAVTDREASSNDGPCSPASILRSNDRSARRPWCRGARR